MRTLLALLCLAQLFAGCEVEEFQDLASELVGTYQGEASDDFIRMKNQEIIVSRISDHLIEVTPSMDNMITIPFRLEIVQDGKYVKHTPDAVDISFEATMSGDRVKLSFQANNPLHSFDGNRKK
ncbi:MAG: hypothetical protein HYZ16_01195 [Bacteroidetes bacterium]|jgi:hypothetical protein|nr:hypothetical protein [Bacteroidota bacterium]